MKIRSGQRGRPKDPRDDARFAPLVAEIDGLEAEVLAAVRAHAEAPTQAATVRLLGAQLRVASMRAHLARTIGDDDVARRESELVIKLAGARDDAVGRMWGDQLDQIHDLVMKTSAVQAEISAELAAELEGETAA